MLGPVRRVGPGLQQHLTSLAGHPIVFDTRGVGLGGAVQLENAPNAVGSQGHPMQVAMMAEGLLFRVENNIINFAPLIITQAEDDEMFARFSLALGAADRVEAAA